MVFRYLFDWTAAHHKGVVPIARAAIRFALEKTIQGGYIGPRQSDSDFRTDRSFLFYPPSRMFRPERTFPLTLQTWAAFSAAATIMVLIPGPTVLMVISHALAHGRRAVAPLTLGVALGDLTAMTLSILGLGALLATSAALFTVLKWVGALYLIYLGIGMWRARPDAAGPTVSVASGRALIGRAFAVTAVTAKARPIRARPLATETVGPAASGRARHIPMPR